MCLNFILKWKLSFSLFSFEADVLDPTLSGGLRRNVEKCAYIKLWGVGCRQWWKILKVISVRTGVSGSYISNLELCLGYGVWPSTALFPKDCEVQPHFFLMFNQPNFPAYGLISEIWLDFWVDFTFNVVNKENIAYELCLYACVFCFYWCCSGFPLD